MSQNGQHFNLSNMVQVNLMGGVVDKVMFLCSVIKPMVAMQMIDNVELRKIPPAVEEKLKKAFDAIK